MDKLERAIDDIRRKWVPDGRLGVFQVAVDAARLWGVTSSRSAQESLRAVPDSLRKGALALGCTRWQMVRRMTLPAAVPGIMTGTILAMSRAIGEAAPVLVIAGIVYITFTPSHLMDDFTVMPLQIFNWAQRPQEEFHRVAASGILVLLGLLLSFNAVAVFIRQKFSRNLS